MKPPILYAHTRAIFADLSDTEWTPQHEIEAEDSTLTAWFQRGYVERRPGPKGRYNTYEYRRAVPVPQKSARARKKAVRLPEVYPATFEPSRETKPATHAQLAAWHNACERIGSLPALISQLSQRSAA